MIPITPTTPFSPSIDHTDASSSSFEKSVCLHDWWLIKAENDFDGRRLGIAGLTYREHHPLREFKSAPILKRHDLFTLETVDGVFIIMEGLINHDRTKENGFPSEVFDHFVFGFPSVWDKFAEKWCGKEPTNEDALTNQILGMIPTDPGEIRSLEDAPEKSSSSFREGDISKTQDNLCDLNTSAVNPSRSAGAGQGSLAKKAPEDYTFMSNSPKRTLEVENTIYSSPVVAEDLSAAPEQVDKHKQPSLATNTMDKNKKVIGKNSNTKSVKLCASKQIVDQPVRRISSRGMKRKVHLDGEAKGQSKNSSVKINEFAEKWCGKEPTNEDASTNQILERISTDPGEIRSLEDAPEKSSSSFREADISKTQDNLCDLNTSAVNPSRSAGAGQGSLAKKAQEDYTFMSNSPKRTLEVENTIYSSPVVAEELSAAPEQVDKHKQPSLATNTMDKNKKVIGENSNTKSVKLCASKQIVDQPVRCISTRGMKRKVHLDGEATGLSINSSAKINETVRSSVRLVEAEGNFDSNTVNKKVKFATNSIRSLKKYKRKLKYESPVTPETTFVSPGFSSPKRSRSGRLLIPTMEFWRNQRIIYDASRSIIGVQDNLCEKRFGRESVSEPPRKRK